MLFLGILGTILLDQAFGTFVLNPVGRIKLPSNVAGDKFSLFSDSADEAAYDNSAHYLYVIGKHASLLHVIDLSTPANPTRLTTIHFPTAQPLDVAVCGSIVAISFTGQIINHDGHVKLYHPYDPISGFVEFHQSEAVAANPEDIKFSSDCRFLVVASEGRPSSDFDTGKFIDHEGGITQFEFSGGGSTIVKTDLDLKSLNGAGPPSTARYVFKGNAQVPMTFSQDLEPEHVAISSTNDHAFIACQKNNALIVITLGTSPSIVSIHGMGLKVWEFTPLDPSSLDNGVHMTPYNIVSFRQPDAISMIKIGGTEYLLASNEGKLTSFSHSGVVFSDHKRGQNATADGDIASLNPRKDDLANVTKLGDLAISTEDGNDAHGKILTTHFFGGRGLSLHNPFSADRALSDTGDKMENTLAVDHPSIFNTRVEKENTATNSPISEFDKNSGLLGPEPEGLAVGFFDAARQVVIAGSKQAGVLHVYSQTGTSTSLVFESSHRAGKTDKSYDVLYSDGESGDLNIADIGYVPASESQSGRPFAFVVSSGSGSVSIYDVLDL